MGSAEKKIEGRAAIWLLGAVFFLAYGSLLPFDFHPRESPDYLRAASGLVFSVGGTSDTLTNIALYVPVGFLGFAAGSRKQWLLLHVAVVLVCVALFSLGLEWLQTWTAQRIGSWNDVRANTIGAALGLVLGIALSRILRHRGAGFQATIASHGLDIATALLVFSLLVFHLLPFDVVRRSEDLRQSFLRAEWSLVQPRLHVGGETPWAALVHQVTSAAWFVLLGALIAKSEQARFRSRMETALRLALHGVTVAILIELFQLFSRVHVFDLASMLVRILAVVIGFYLAWTARRWSHAGFLRCVPTAAICAVCCLVACLGASQIAAIPTADACTFVHVRDWPLESVWRLNTLSALLEVAEAVAYYGPLALGAYLAIHRFPQVVRRLTAVILVTVTAACLEWLRAANQAIPAFDLSEPVLAAMSAWSTLHLMQWVRQLPTRAEHRQVSAADSRPHALDCVMIGS